MITFMVNDVAAWASEQDVLEVMARQLAEGKFFDGDAPKWQVFNVGLWQKERMHHILRLSLTAFQPHVRTGVAPHHGGPRPFQ